MKGSIWTATRRVKADTPQIIRGLAGPHLKIIWHLGDQKGAAPNAAHHRMTLPERDLHAHFQARHRS
jgi:hypothetical protein